MSTILFIRVGAETSVEKLGADPHNISASTCARCVPQLLLLPNLHEFTDGI